MDYPLSEFANVIAEYFNLEELKSLCFKLGIEYDNLGDNLGVKASARELVKYAKRYSLLDALVVACQEVRPNAIWTEQETDPPKVQYTFPVIASGTKQLVGIKMARFERQLNDLEALLKPIRMTWAINTTLGIINTLLIFVLLVRGLFS